MKIKSAKKYFEKNGYIYGDSYKYDFGEWKHTVRKFTSWEEAVEWYNTEEYDFKEREMISKTEALKYDKNIK